VGVRVLTENYPDLRASEQFRRLQAQLAEVEGEIQYARRIYNANVQRYNTRVRSFPGSLVRRLGGYQPTGYFELNPVRLDMAAERKPAKDRKAAAA
jgi:LemA protein